MPLPLEQRFRKELVVLEELFSEAQVRECLSRLDEIHRRTEAKWREYVEQLRGGRVNYLLIAEAPPWSDTGSPQYVLDPRSRPRTLMRALRKVFSVPEHSDSEEALAVFACRGFLMVDSIPFSMNYSRKRGKPQYKELVSLTARTYLQAKLKSESLRWSRNAGIAFSVKRNAFAVKQALSGKVDLKGRRHRLSPKMIAVNGAGYPDADKLRKIWGI